MKLGLFRKCHGLKKAETPGRRLLSETEPVFSPIIHHSGQANLLASDVVETIDHAWSPEYDTELPIQVPNEASDDQSPTDYRIRRWKYQVYRPCQFLAMFLDNPITTRLPLRFVLNQFDQRMYTEHRPLMPYELRAVVIRRGTDGLLTVHQISEMTNSTPMTTESEPETEIRIGEVDGVQCVQLGKDDTFAVAVWSFSESD